MRQPDPFYFACSMAHREIWVRQLRLFDPFPFSVYSLSQGDLVSPVAFDFRS